MKDKIKKKLFRIIIKAKQKQKTNKQKNNINLQIEKPTMGIEDIIKNSENQEKTVIEFINQLERDDIKYYRTIEELKKDWSLEDYFFLEEANNIDLDNDKSIDREEKRKIVNLKEKFKKLEENYMIISRGIADWNKNTKAVGMLFPIPDATEFYMEKYFFINIGILREIKKNRIFQKNKIFKDSEVDSLKLYEFMIANEFEHIEIKQYNSKSWMLIGRKEDKKDVRLDAFSNEDIRVLERQLLSDIGETDSDRAPTVEGTCHVKMNNIINDKSNIVIGDKTFRIVLMQQSKPNNLISNKRKKRSIDIRVLDNAEKLRHPDEIGYLEDDLELIKKGFYDDQKKDVNKKLTVYLGQPGSWKSTSMSSLIKYYLWGELHLSMLVFEDMQEFDIDGVHHVDLSETKKARNEDSKLDLEKAFNTSLRMKRDIVFFQEIISSEVIRFCIESITRGRGVAATAHTTDCYSFFTLLKTLGISPFQYIPFMGQLIFHEPVEKLCKCKGLNKECRKCNGTGTYGKELIYEIASFVDSRLDIDCDLTQDFYKLIEEGKIKYKSKYQVAKEKFNMGLISKDILDYYKKIEKSKIDDN